MSTPDSFPRQNARTQRFTLGAPRDVTVSRDGTLVAFLRSAGPEDPVTALWVLDVASGTERCAADPRALLADDDAELPAAERARRERARESAAGITAYATDATHTVAIGALAGRLVVADLRAGTARLFDIEGAVIDPRPDPTGERVAWVQDGALWVADLADPTTARVLADDPAEAVSWGVAEFVAAEEMDRHRGYWWSSDGAAILAARVDESPVDRWWIADPARPNVAPTEVAYPAAGRPNADVSLWILPLAGDRSEVVWDRSAWPYLAAAGWDSHGALLAVHPRDQRAIEVRSVDVRDGSTAPLWSDADDVWVERAPGTPARLRDGRLVMCSDRDGTRRLMVNGMAVTPADLHVRGVSHVGDEDVLVTANPVDDSTGFDVWRWSSDGLVRVSDGPGVHNVSAGGGTTVLRSSTLDAWGTHTHVLGGPTIGTTAAVPDRQPEVTIQHLGPRRLATALLLPSEVPEGARLPVLLNPYGGPHAQQVLQARAAYGTSQWFADQGYAVVVIDGRGTPGRGSAWERAIHLDLATAVLEDQLDALAELGRIDVRLDLDRVAIRGWSFGGYLAALAVLRRPDVVHAAIAGAPVTDWRLYDTFYTERYLGHPDTHPEAYERSSLLGEAHKLERPLLLVHGLADDNVVSAHTLQLSARLLAAGRPHEVLPLTGVTHMASQEEVAENLLLLQLDFLRRSL